MRILGPNDVVAGEIVELVAAKTIDHAGRNAQCPQHDRHGRREVFAVSLLALEKKIGQGIGHGQAWQLQGVDVVGLQISFERRRFVVVIGTGGRDLRRQLWNTPIKFRQPQVRRSKLRKGVSRVAKLFGRWPGNIGVCLVNADGSLGIDVGNRTARIDLQSAILAGYPPGPRS